VGLLILTPWAAFGAPPTVAIKSPTTSDSITPGDIVVLDADVSTAPSDPEVPAADVRVRWFVEPELFADGKPTFLVLEQGLGKLPRVQLATRSGRLRVELIAVVGGEIGRVVKDVVVAGVGPTPAPPQPQPQPSPLPSVSDKHGFVALIRTRSAGVTTQRQAAAKIAAIYANAASVAKAGSLNPTDPTVVQIVGLLLKASGVSSDLSRGVTLNTANDVITQLVTAQISVTERTAWRDVMIAVSDRLRSEATDLVTCAECLAEITTALGEVK